MPGHGGGSRGLLAKERAKAWHEGFRSAGAITGEALDAAQYEGRLQAEVETPSRLLWLVIGAVAGLLLGVVFS